jgi:sulfate permease, SulP family
MTPEKTEIHGTRLPVLQGVLPIAMARVSADVIAGVTLASLAIPEVMGYTKIAGTPVITGLYTLLIPMVLFALFGSSRHLVVGADSATAAILAAGLASMAATGSAEYVALASLLALMASAFLILARIVRLGFLADFLSRTVLVGFLTGVGIQVAFGEVPRLLGIEGGGHGTVATLTHVMQNVNQISGTALAVAAAVLVLIVGCRRISGRIPGPLIAVIGAIIVSWALDLQSFGVSVLGAIPSGLPEVGLPSVDWSWNLISKLLPTAFSIFVVILAQSAATSRALMPPATTNLSARTWIWWALDLPISAQGCREPLSSMAARPKPRWSTARAGKASSRRSQPP